MNPSRLVSLAIFAAFLVPGASPATTIDEVLTAPVTPGNSYRGEFSITPSEATWAFGVGNPTIDETSGPASPFIAFSAADGSESIMGETAMMIVPEPGTSALVLSGMMLLGWCGRKRLA